MRVLCFTLRRHIFNKHGYFANPPFITLGTILISKEGYKPIRIHNTIKFNNNINRAVITKISPENKIINRLNNIIVKEKKI